MFCEADKTVRTTMKVARLYRFGNRRLARAHLALQRRPQVAAALSSALAQATSALQGYLGHAVRAEAALLENVFTLSRHLSHDAVFLLVELDAVDSSAVVEIERPVLHALIDRLSGATPRPVPSSHLTRIEESALGFLSLVLLQSLRSAPWVASGLGARIGRINVARADVLALLGGIAPHVGVRVQVAAGDVTGVVRVLVPCPALMTALQGVQEDVPHAIAPELLTAELTIQPVLGSTTLDAVAVQTLRRGDVVLFDGVCARQGAVHGTGRLCTPTFELFGAFGAEGFGLTHSVPRTYPQEVVMSSASSEDQTVALPVEVEIELTRLRLTLGQLAAIRPGALLPLRIDASDPVTLKIGHRAIARAELVEIEGEVGARITSLLS